MLHRDVTCKVFLSLKYWHAASAAKPLATAPTSRGSLKFRKSMIDGVASSCRPPRDCSRRNRKRSQRNKWIVIQARAAIAVVGSARRHCCLVERVHFGLALGGKADMRSPGVRIALPEPEEYAAVPSEALEVGMS